MMRRQTLRLGLVWVALATAGLGQGTKLWSVGRFDEMQRGTSEGVAIRGDPPEILRPLRFRELSQGVRAGRRQIVPR